MYDPLVDSSIPSNLNSPDSFWAENVRTKCFPAICDDIETDVVIIGAGYTGLSCALALSQTYNINPIVVEANQPGFGCSGRNGGFVLPGTGRLGIDAIKKRWGLSLSQAVYNEYLSSIQAVSDLIDDGIDCGVTRGGYLKLAHHPQLVEPLYEQAAILSDLYGDSVKALSTTQIHESLLSGTRSHGGIYFPNAFGINPYQLTQELAKRVSEAGCHIYGNSAVENHTFNQGLHCLTVNGKKITAKTLVIATNGYTSRRLFSILKDKTFPVLSSILVTKPLSDAQLSALGIKPGLMVMDTRALKYYYRLLPDNRLLFGGRGSITGKNAHHPSYQNALLKGLQATFPSLSSIEVASFWSGWVSVSLDDYPRIHHEKYTQTLYSSGYCGAGLAFSIQAGKRLAQLLMEPDTLPDLPYWQSPLKKFPLPMLRRPALSAFYAWQSIQKYF